MLLEAYQKKQIDMDQCTGCELCAQLCPARAIAMRENDEGFLYPEVNDYMCVHCGQCAARCPVLEPMLRKNTGCTRLYSGYERTLQYQERCSSGGIFGVLADKILQAGGVVFGASFDPKTKSVSHVSSNEVNLMFKVCIES